MLPSFYVNVIQSNVIWEEGNTIEKMLLWDWLVGKSAGYFLD